ncbi:MAG: ketopantoate reductase family protein [Candidatus Hydrogenedentota bacterium]
MNILVMGAGAIGSVLGGFLAKAGHTVTLVGRAKHMDAIRRNGLTISGIFGEHRIETLRPCVSVSEAGGVPYGFVFLTVKSYDTERAVEELAPLVSEDTLVCSYQNGLGNVDCIAAQFGWARTVGARAIYGVRLPEPGHADVTVIAKPTAIGRYDTATPETPLKRIAEDLDTAGLPTVYTERIATILWSKVAYNCALNPLSALLDAPYGRLLETSETRELMTEIVHELYAVGKAMGVELEPDNAEACRRQLFDELIPPTANHYASMREDFRLKRRTEIGALNGAIAAFGRQQGVPTPANTRLTLLVRAYEQLHSTVAR